ncbi:23S rRNA (guanosine(2251)-2'-O)-methyltransferase RlmB [Ascidiimonas sp. W6]|uniref:23S rRNA (guanosine(2251)-2'-O)-methyltransferase RlmB n=1 Tax=Ascidiimonas meishanensis TaxID=3128903 RepID=UPI0030EC93FA
MKKSTQIFGIRAIMEAIHANEDIDKVFLQNGLKGNLSSELEHLLKSKEIPFSYVPIEKLNRITKMNHQGAIANIAPIRFVDFEELVSQIVESKSNPLFLLLDQVTDTRNFGAIIRTAECTGVDAIIIPRKGGAPVNADTVKTSAGGIFNIPICKTAHIKDAIYYLQASGVKVVAATEKTSQSIYQISLNTPLAIVMGAEDTGISASVLKITDELAMLPMKGKIGSLNVSVACGVILYEVLRQRNYSNSSS